MFVVFVVFVVFSYLSSYPSLVLPPLPLPLSSSYQRFRIVRLQFGSCTPNRWKIATLKTCRCQLPCTDLRECYKEVWRMEVFEEWKCLEDWRSGWRSGWRMCLEVCFDSVWVLSQLLTRLWYLGSWLLGRFWGWFFHYFYSCLTSNLELVVWIVNVSVYGFVDLLCCFISSFFFLFFFLFLFLFLLFYFSFLLSLLLFPLPLSIFFSSHFATTRLNAL